VLDIGPGATPHPKASVLLEMRYDSPEEFARQCGGTEPEAIDPRTVFYDGGRFPFETGEFDYVICSHVVEHVPDLEAFCAELFRVAKAGYLEYPLIYYDFVYDIPEHVNVLKRSGGALVYLPKRELALGSFAGIQQFWFRALSSGYNDTVGDLVPWLMEGFEWFAPFEVRRASSIGELLHTDVQLPPKTSPPSRRVRYAAGLRRATQRLLAPLRHDRG
jgi:SAM-dependent methyltransferase